MKRTPIKWATVIFVVVLVVLLMIGLASLLYYRGDDHVRVMDAREAPVQVLFVGNQSWTVTFSPAIDEPPDAQTHGRFILRLGKDTILFEIVR